MRYAIAMIEELHVFYTCGGSDTKVKSHCKKHGIELSEHATGVEYILSDPKPTIRDELLFLARLIRSTKRKVFVHLFQFNELGQGEKAAKERRKLEALGATVLVAADEPQKRGPKVKHKLTAELKAEFQSDFDGPLTRQGVCDKILRVTTERKDPVKMTPRQLDGVYKK